MWRDRALVLATLLPLAAGASRGHEVLSLASGAALGEADYRQPGAAVIIASGISLRGSATVEIDGSMFETMKAGPDTICGSLATAVSGLVFVVLVSGAASTLLRGRSPGASAKTANSVAHCDASGRTAQAPQRQESGQPHEAGAGTAQAAAAGEARAAADAPREVAPLGAAAAAARGPGAQLCAGRARGAAEEEASTSDALTATGGDAAALSPGASVFCAGLVVRRPDGMTLALIKYLAAGQPSEVIEARNVDGSREVVGRAISSEYLGEQGVIVESSLRLPIAFLRLGTDAEAPRGERAGGYVNVSRTVPSSAGGPAGPPFCTVRLDGEAEGFLMWRGTGAEGVLILAIRPRSVGAGFDVVDNEGRPLATMEACTPDPAPRSSLGLLHVSAGVDAGLIMVAILASRTLQ